jgi:hypothetical protein
VKNTSVLVSGVSITTSATITSNSLIRLDGGASTTAAMSEILHELGRRRGRPQKFAVIAGIFPVRAAARESFPRGARDFC